MIPTMSAGPRFLSSDDVRDALTVAEAADALERALLAGVDPEAEPARMIVPVETGQVIVMPAAAGALATVKLVTAGGTPRVQGLVVAFAIETLAPIAVLDGIALTVIRTTAVSLLAARHLAPPRPRRLVVFGRGPQAVEHAEALRSQFDLEHVQTLGSDATAAEADGAVAGADIVCCATTATEPLFDGGRVADHALVIAVGSHEPTVREVDERLVARSHVVVESRQSALREAGDLIIAGADPARMTTLAELTAGVGLPTDQPRFFKSTGMAWEDTAVTGAILSAEPSTQTGGVA
jgi:ornithine cyclodeaminase/alanine dehydrogenase-like protein (mu-crystallin family)